ncbi:hypothetical protein NQ176_g400 [Zarea fungicola]|uniref:Uncharacterized protein n=1 Tax=Zarea fungicola TaxID=93591 RepID=A0ACC1NX13_9HYPO|nr:hypothetical protein NQ176_g400 [Lecanicillium fungicola]
MISAVVFGFALALTTLLWRMVSLPTSRPRQIPTIPFWISLFDYCRGYGRLAFYDYRLRPLLEAHGAVNVWIAGHWSILVTKPAYLVEIFRNEHIIAKAGFRTKVPWGVFARYFGESVITSHGETWKVMHTIVQPAINRPIDMERMRYRTQELTSAISAQMQQSNKTPNGKTSLVIDELAQRWTISIFGDFFLDMDCGRLDDNGSLLAQFSGLQSRMKRSFPSPIFSEFPMLEKFPWLFKSRQKAFENIDQFEELLLQSTAKISREYAKDENKNKLIYQLKEARESGVMSEYHYRSNMKNLFAAGHEDVEQAFISLIWTLSVNQNLQDRLRQEIDQNLPLEYNASDLKGLPFLSAAVYEIFRLFPPIFQLTNRITLQPTMIGDIPVPAGVYIGWNAYGVQTNPEIWGDDAKKFRPERWGHTAADVHMMWRTQQAKGNLITFNGYKRKCLGANFAVVQLMTGMCEMVRQFTWTADPSYKFQVTTVSFY